MYNYDRVLIGKKLQEIRKEKGLTLKELADKHLSQATLTRIEQGKDSIALEKCDSYAEKLGEKLENIIKEAPSQDIEFQNFRLKLATRYSALFTTKSS